MELIRNKDYNFIHDYTRHVFMTNGKRLINQTFKITILAIDLDLPMISSWYNNIKLKENRQKKSLARCIDKYEK